MKNLKQWYYPSTVEAALALLRAGEGQVRVIAGGTALAESRDPNIEALVDITRIPRLHGIQIESDGSLRIGSSTTAIDLARTPLASPLVKQVLCAAAGSISHHLHRNLITVGGNIVQLYPWSDLPCALLALDARYLIQGDGVAPRWLEAIELTRQVPRKVLSHSDLLESVVVPPPAPRSGGVFLKLARTVTDYALVTAASRVDLDESGRIADCRLVLATAVVRPLRLTALEAKMKGALPEEGAVAIAEAVGSTVTPMPDFRVSADYRLELCQVLVRRAFLAAANQASENVQGRLS